jgi:hypothetical protein
MIYIVSLINKAKEEKTMATLREEALSKIPDDSPAHGGGITSTQKDIPEMKYDDVYQIGMVREFIIQLIRENASPVSTLKDFDNMIEATVHSIVWARNTVQRESMYRNRTISSEMDLIRLVEWALADPEDKLGREDEDA